MRLDPTSSTVWRLRGWKLSRRWARHNFGLIWSRNIQQSPAVMSSRSNPTASTYYSSYTARDRDRLRRLQLENLGWGFHRIWSTDWFMLREEEI